MDEFHEVSAEIQPAKTGDQAKLCINIDTDIKEIARRFVNERYRSWEDFVANKVEQNPHAIYETRTYTYNPSRTELWRDGVLIGFMAFKTVTDIETGTMKQKWVIENRELD